MPRCPRSFIETSYFHVIVQGINKSYIFNYTEDIKYYIKLLYKIKNDHNISIISYCIMNNHAHMLLNVNQLKELSKYMQRVNEMYAFYYNKKYNRVGYVFRDRYKCEGIYSEEQLYHCKKYIYNNPVKAGICNKPGDYLYSNYKPNEIEKFNNMEYVFMDVEKEDEKNCKKIIQEFLMNENIELKNLKNNKRVLRQLLFILKKEHNISIRKISKELNISRETLRNVYRI